MSVNKNFKVDFICIGPERSGTTWLYQCLKEHPEICVSEPKEVNFFNSSQSFWRKDLIGQTNYTKGLEWYKQHFNHCLNKKIIGEFTPIYLHSPEVPERIHKHFPDVKLIAILRNPIERLYSHYRYTELKGFYQLPTFKEVIDKDPEAFIRKVLKFLGADETFIPPSTHTTINPAGALVMRNKVLSIKDSIKSVLGGNLMINILKKTPLRKKIFDSLATKTGTVKVGYGKIEPDIKKRLFEFYKEDIENLEKFLGRDLAYWKK